MAPFVILRSTLGECPNKFFMRSDRIIMMTMTNFTQWINKVLE